MKCHDINDYVHDEIDSQSVIDLTTEDEAEDNTMLVEQQNDCVNYDDEEQQQSSAQLLQHMAVQHVVTSWVESEQPPSFSNTQTCPDKANQPATLNSLSDILEKRN